MNGFGSHTFMWINAGGERFWVKYHFKTDQGIEFLTDAEAKAMAAEDPDSHLRDLYEAIARGDAPEWPLEVQVMPFEDAGDYRFNPFDLTKVWPHADYPPITIGRMVLDRNPENYFAEVEQSAFEPANMVPGHRPEPGQDAAGPAVQLPRHPPLPDRPQLPAAPGQPAQVRRALYNKDGAMRYQPPGRPRSTRRTATAARQADPSASAPTRPGGRAARSSAPPTGPAREDDDFGQAGSLYREVLTETDRDHLVTNIVGHWAPASTSRCSSAPWSTGARSTPISEPLADGLGLGGSGNGAPRRATWASPPRRGREWPCSDAYAHWEYNFGVHEDHREQDAALNMRVAEDVDAIVRLAAEQTDQPLTDFVVQAARVVAEDTLADRRVFRIDQAAWDEFVEILDRPARSVPELARLLSSASVFDD